MNKTKPNFKDKIQRIFTFNSNEFETAVVFFVFPLIIGLMTSVVINIKNPFNYSIIENQWIGFYGNLFGALLGVIIAIMIFRSEDNRDKKENEKKLEVYFYQFFGIYLNEVSYNCANLKNSIELKLKEEIYDPDLLIYQSFSSKDYSEKLALLLIENKLSEEILFDDVIIKNEIVFYNKLLLEIRKIYNQNNGLVIDIKQIEGLYRLLLDCVVGIEKKVDEVQAKYDNKYKKFNYDKNEKIY